MSRAIPDEARIVLEREASAEALVWFVDITHPALGDQTIRAVSDGASYVLDGETYLASGLEVAAVSDDGEPPKAVLRVPNVDRRAFMMLKDVADPAQVRCRLISTVYFSLTADPRTVRPGMTVEPVFDQDRLFLTDVTIDAVEMSGTINGYDYRKEAYPNLTASRRNLPGIYVR